jgi:hypothetical protein
MALTLIPQSYSVVSALLDLLDVRTSVSTALLAIKLSRQVLVSNSTLSSILPRQLHDLVARRPSVTGDRRWLCQLRLGATQCRLVVGAIRRRIQVWVTPGAE